MQNFSDLEKERIDAENELRQWQQAQNILNMQEKSHPTREEFEVWQEEKMKLILKLADAKYRLAKVCALIDAQNKKCAGE